MYLKKWNEKDDEYVLSHLSMSNAELADKLGRTVISIQSRRQFLKKYNYKRSGAKWENYELQLIKNGCTNKTLCHSLQRGPKEINAMRHALKHGLSVANVVNSVIDKQVKKSADPHINVRKLNLYMNDTTVSSDMKVIVTNCTNSILEGHWTKQQVSVMTDLGLLK